MKDGIKGELPPIGNGNGLVERVAVNYGTAALGGFFGGEGAYSDAYPYLRGR